MRYFRKVTCTELNIKATFDNQAHALRLFTLLYDKGFSATTKLEDYFVDESTSVTLNDDEFDLLIAKI